MAEFPYPSNFGRRAKVLQQLLAFTTKKDFHAHTALRLPDFLERLSKIRVPIPELWPTLVKGKGGGWNRLAAQLIEFWSASLAVLGGRLPTLDRTAVMVSLATRLAIVSEAGLARVGPSGVSGRGVFATRSMPVNTIVTTYPLDGVHIYDDEKRMTIFFDPAIQEKADAMEAYVKKKYFEGVYNISVCDKVTGFTDPGLHTPERCGHLLNSTFGTGTPPNCGLVSLGGIALVLVTLKDVAADEELLWNYGPNYWKNR